jgi:hypothetical protein
MLATEVADLCLLESGTRGLSKHAREVALVGLLVAPDGAISMREYRRRIKETYMQVHPDRGSFFLIFVLPVLISLISNWIAKWIINRTDMKRIRSQAFDILSGSVPSWTGTRMSTSSPPRNQTEQ